jgi:hypothetical protein
MYWASSSDPVRDYQSIKQPEWDATWTVVDTAFSAVSSFQIGSMATSITLLHGNLVVVLVVSSLGFIFKDGNCSHSMNLLYLVFAV